MSDTTRTLLQRVSGLMYVGTLTRRLAWALAAGIFAGVVGLLALRLTGYLPTEQSRWALAVGPAAAALLVLGLTRRPKRESAARLVDERAETGDLFLAAASPDDRAESFEPLVAKRATEKAAEIDPAGVVRPFEKIKVGWLAAALGLAVAADVFCPVLDPFGVVEAATRTERQAEDIERTKEQVAIRKSQLDLDKPDEELSPEVQEALDELEQNVAGLGKREGGKKESWNETGMPGSERRLGRLWEKTSKKLASEMLSKEAAGQRFGGETDKKFDEWKEAMKKGDPQPVLDELKEIQQLLEKAAAAETAEGKDAALAQAEKKMQQLKKFAEQELGSPELAQAIEQAMRQMDAARNEEVSSEAMQAMQEATDVGEMEAEALAQAARDMKGLESAMEMIREMKALEGERQPFDASECEDCQTLEDYEEFYKQQMAGMEGDGTGGEGEGDSEAVEEDDSVSTGFKKEQSDSFLKKGKMLMSLMGKGEGMDNEDDLREFKAIRRELSQEASEAVEAENIPPGYHERIKKYFRSIDAEERN